MYGVSGEVEAYESAVLEPVVNSEETVHDDSTEDGEK